MPDLTVAAGGEHRFVPVVVAHDEELAADLDDHTGALPVADHSAVDADPVACRHLRHRSTSVSRVRLRRRGRQGCARIPERPPIPGARRPRAVSIRTRRRFRVPDRLPVRMSRARSRLVG
ncbi:hypothetical protein MICRO8M_70064 [Microbacterium sp. 8M]|nr:hypothetical protein MICRO8M_70064 [Microbacterium sp. 8M]